MSNIDLLALENRLYDQNYNNIAGVDEVGRGPLAGPVVAAAVILPQNVSLPGVNDSKKLSEKKRNEYYQLIMDKALAVSIGQATVAEIDQLNILQATKLAMTRAVNGLNITPEYLRIDGPLTLDITTPQSGIIKGDSKSLSIAAASIVAKCFRDHKMKELGTMYPVYGFETNAGYGTKTHRAALETNGYIKDVHRTSFEPIKSMIKQPSQGRLF